MPLRAKYLTDGSLLTRKKDFGSIRTLVEEARTDFRVALTNEIAAKAMSFNPEERAISCRVLGTNESAKVNLSQGVADLFMHALDGDLKALDEIAKEVSGSSIGTQDVQVTAKILAILLDVSKIIHHVESFTKDLECAPTEQEVNDALFNLPVEIAISMKEVIQQMDERSYYPSVRETARRVLSSIR